jgi:hypothetical protein|tara:strand:+ start:233 stop:451 length:219 start_codon:yes stop_codon:yes gene_type:complete
MPKKFSWRKQKTLAVLANRRQWRDDFDPVYTSATEIATEQLATVNGLFEAQYIIREVSASRPKDQIQYIITE